MRNKALSILAATGFALVVSSALAADTGMSGSTGWPGDDGRLNEGIEPLVDAPMGPAPVLPKAPDINYAVKTAQAIVTACKQFHVGVGVVNAKGEPVLIYIPNGSEGGHAFWALRKAITAVTFKMPTSALVSKGRDDKVFAAKIRANTHMIAFSGAVLIKSGDEVIGALAVSGAEPGHHDEECALKGMAQVAHDQK